jgi:hypothetical protein
VRDEESSWEALETSIAALGQAGHEGLATRLLRLTATVAKEAASRPSFAKALDVAMSPPTVGEESGGGPKGSDRASGRRAAPVLDPFVIHREAGPDSLRQSLGQLSLEQLKDIIAEHGMDRDKLAMKWKTPDRLIDRITTTVSSRAQKGDVFRR